MVDPKNGTFSKMAEYVLLVSINKNVLPYLVLFLLASLIGEVFLPDPV